MGGESHIPVVIKPVGEPPPDKPELAIETSDLWLHCTKGILTQQGCLATGDAPALSPACVPASKLPTSYDASSRKASRLTPEECLALRDGLLAATAEDVIGSGISIGTPPDPERVESWLTSCRHTADFFDECAGLGGVSVSVLPERAVSW
jgi:hypothetical protein